MAKSFQKIMLVTNEPSDTKGAELTAINFGKTNNGSVHLVDSIRTPFRRTENTPILAQDVYDAAYKAKRSYLEKLQTQFAQEGVQSTTEILLGSRTSTELIRTAMQHKSDLVIRYMKGQSSRAAGRFGETAANLMRACPVPVLFTEKEIADPKVVACINLDHGHEENQAILENARRLVNSPADLMVVSCWEFTGSDFMIDYVDEGLLEQTRDEAGDMYVRLFNALQTEYSLDDLEDQVFLFNENPATAIPKFCKEYDIDIAVMCSASLNHPLGRKLGSTIEKTIAELPCALLTVKPIGFTTGISLDESITQLATQPLC